MQLKKMIMETVPARFDGRDCWVMWHKINDEIIPAINELLTNTPPNEPLTLDELRQMDGEPVYVVPVNEFSELGKWCVLSVDDSDDYSCALVPGTDCWRWRFEAYGEQWLAYRRPPEGEKDA